jgi:hypothetical protein
MLVDGRAVKCFALFDMIEWVQVQALAWNVYTML